MAVYNSDGNIQLADIVSPPVGIMTGTAGVGLQAARHDHTHPVRVQRFRGTAASDGTVTWTFATPFNIVPTVQYMVENGADQPMIANIVELDVSHVKAKLFQSNKLPATLTLLTSLVSFNIFGVSNAALAGTALHLSASEPTQ